MVLICHCPPLNTPLDEAASGRHFGSRAWPSSSPKSKPSGSSAGTFTKPRGAPALLGKTRGVNAGKRLFAGAAGLKRGERAGR